MQNNLYKTITVWSIIFLFIGLSATSSISGDIRISKQSNENPETLPLNNDYVLAYWKFDEGSGTILEDSSGHDYDGTINGATWVTGHSGYALDFDGANDYVALDTYSEQLGMNKTDDLIYSLWFKTTSNEDGLIYSMSDSWNTQNPEFSIQSCSNGSILFKVWTNQCGITLYSSGSYNNGTWHHLYIIYRGSTSKPTVELYVNNDPGDEITEWLCEIEHDEFKRAKIGRRAVDATKHFDGAIDEFKIIKYPGGNEQNPPEISTNKIHQRFLVLRRENLR
jgi:hypothetical protein